MAVPLASEDHQQMFIPDEIYIIYFAAEKFDKVWKKK